MTDTFIRNAEQLLVELLSIPGGSGREAKVADFITRKLREAGADKKSISTDDAPRRSPIGGEVGNLVFKLPGTISGKRRMLMAHMDTVPLCIGARPVRRGRYLLPADKNTGLGADDRSGTAVLLAVALAILKHGLPHPPLTFFWTVQEEVGLYGARHAKLSLLGRPRLAFNFDGGNADKVTIGATGGYRMDIQIQGLASHAGAAPELGVSAIAIAAMAIAKLHHEGWHGKIEKNGRRGTSNVGIIHGGDATNVVTPYVEVRAEARSHDPRFRRRIIRMIERAFQQAARKVHNAKRQHGSVRISGRLDYESFRLPEDDPSLLAAEAAIRQIGFQPFRVISNGGLDANWLTARGIPTVSLGCGQENFHTPAERLNLPEFHKACRIARQLATAES
ncbi:MAG TPA: M20/M25/M40 family metallo-hydrolase [Thermoguttaceae bacterium]